MHRTVRTAVGVARHGGMAPYAAVPTKVLHRLPDGVSTKQGAWAAPLARTALGPHLGRRHGDPAIVFGTGPIGLLVITLLRAMGAGMITALEPSRLRAVKAKVVGADDVIDPLAVDPASVFPETASAPAYGFECGSRGGGTESALRVLRPRRGA